MDNTNGTVLSYSSDNDSVYVKVRSDLQDQLSLDQRREFSTFRVKCLSLCQNTDGDVESRECRDGIDDEPTLLRFFQARKYDAQKAYTHFHEVHESRKVNRLDDLYATIDIRDFEETAALYPRWSGCRDKRGLPVYLFDLAHINPKSTAAHKASSEVLSATESDQKPPGLSPMDVRRAYVVHEHLIRFVFPLCSAAQNKSHHNIPITKQLIIADITGVSIRKMWQLRDYIQDFSKILSVHYPEILDRVLVVGAPYYMATILGWVQKWVDPVTFAKLQLVDSKDVLPTLSSYMDIKDIPRKYGGGLDATEESWPVVGSEVEDALEWTSSNHSIPRGPIVWRHDTSLSRVAIAVGVENGRRRQSQIAVLRCTPA